RSRSPRRRNERRPSPRRNESAPRNSPRREDRHARYSPRRRSPRWNSPPPRHHRRHSPVEEERHQGPLSRRIMDLQLPAGLEKPPAMDIYDGSTDPVD
ncbi:hypothetical protein A2U01_0073996, partial [Trifolium medium]|nr:hypothetical protein [Trifolium medium]